MDPEYRIFNCRAIIFCYSDVGGMLLDESVENAEEALNEFSGI